MGQGIEQALAARLQQRKDEHLYRQRATTQSACSARVKREGKEQLLFCSNDYLGLANHPKVIEAANIATKRYGFGSGASHLVSGHSEAHEALEQALAAFTGRERALLFSTGFMANTGTLTALLGKGDTVLQDRLNHASLLDGGLASGARFKRFRHNDVADCERLLATADPEKQTLIAVDAIFSMDGDAAPLPQLAELAAQKKAWLMADDAHGFGVNGERGAGAAELLSQSQLPIYMATLGKALGGFGAFVAGSEALIESLIQFARPYIYTTALPPSVAAANLAALQLLSEEAWRRDRLRDHIQNFKAAAVEHGWPLMPSDTAIQPLLIGDSHQALRISEQLQARGIWVSAIRPPTVPAGTARLRITLSAAHSEDDIARLVDVLTELLSGE